MTFLLLLMYGGDYEVIVIFANTGFEHERTLRFVHLCSVVLRFNVVWVEAVIHSKHGVGTTHRVVSFETASRNAEPFEAMIAKFGIPNKNYPHCTRELKLRPMDSYLKSIGWTEYTTAIGIRSDEIDRMSSTAEEKGLFYPLVAWKVTKAKVRAWWRDQLFDLAIREHYGNCLTCWKKSERKLLTLAKESPHLFDFFARMEREHGFTGPNDGRPRVFFRGRKTVADIFERAKQPFEPFREENPPPYDPELDEGGACGETCEVGADE